MHDESVPLVEVEADRVAFERRFAALERHHQQVDRWVVRGRNTQDRYGTLCAFGEFSEYVRCFRGADR